MNHITHEIFQFHYHKTIQVRQDLYAFRSEPTKKLNVTRYNLVTKLNMDDLAPTKNKTVENDQVRYYFALAASDDAIYISGGYIDATCSNSVLKFDLES